MCRHIAVVSGALDELGKDLELTRLDAPLYLFVLVSRNLSFEQSFEARAIVS